MVRHYATQPDSVSLQDRDGNANGVYVFVPVIRLGAKPRSKPDTSIDRATLLLAVVVGLAQTFAGFPKLCVCVNVHVTSSESNALSSQETAHTGIEGGAVTKFAHCVESAISS